MKLNGNGILHKKVDFYPVSQMSGIIVKTKEDLKLVNQLLNLNKKKNYKISYYN